MTTSQQTVELVAGDCVAVLAAMEPNSIDAIVTDPPYGLEFMGMDWDKLSKDPNVGKMRKQGFDQANGKPDQRAQNQGGTWFGSREASAPNYYRTTNVKCRNCGKWKISGGHDGKGNTLGCQCAVPDFPNVKAEAARSMQAWHETWAREAFRVLKPGGHLLAFSGTRTQHRMVSAIEDAGFEIRDSIVWMFGSGFPKSLDVGKAIDKSRRRDYVIAAVDLGLDVPGNSLHDWTKAEHSPGDAWWERFKACLSADDWQRIERKVTGHNKRIAGWFTSADGHDITAPATPEAAQWDGWGTALKPGHEPICVARKPLAEKTVAANVLKYSTGGLNIDGCRIEGAPRTTHKDGDHRQKLTSKGVQGGAWGNPDANLGSCAEVYPAREGRWPANVLLDEEAAALLDDQSGYSHDSNRVSAGIASAGNGITHGRMNEIEHRRGFADAGGASRFFYTAKASRSERNAGLDGMPERRKSAFDDRPSGTFNERIGRVAEQAPVANHHPTVKPIALMRYLVRLITPPDGIVLDPFAGSGSTGCAAVMEDASFIGVDLNPDYLEIAERRIAHWHALRQREKMTPRQQGFGGESW